MPISAHLRRWVRSPPGACALVALAVRLVAIGEGLARNPMVMRPQLDGWIYLAWGHDIAGGDLLGKGGLVGGDPWFFNPLYAYLIAPVMAGFEAPSYPLQAAIASRLPWILVAQALLAAGTAAFTAAAAGRLFGRRAAWLAGLAFALCSACAHLDAHVAVAGLGTFLVAGTLYSCAPDRAGEAGAAEGRLRGWRGPIASGLWLGIGALARPITPVAMPLIAWLHARRSPRPWRSGIAVAVVFSACAVPSLARNWGVSGEPFVYTASAGANFWLGWHPGASKFRGMTSSSLFRFDPREMHGDARAYVGRELGHEPTWGEVTDHLKGKTADYVRANPGRSAALAGHKLRWFLTPLEVPSSASHRIDVSFSWALKLAAVPVWLLGALGLTGMWLFRRRRDVLFGPGALVAAHVFVLTMVFPISHYRVPAVPALAVLAAGALDWGLAAWHERRRGAVAAAAAFAAALAVAGALPPRPNTLRFSEELNLAHAYRHLKDYERALEHIDLAIAAHRAEWPDDVFPDAYFVRGDTLLYVGRALEGVDDMAHGLELQPGNVRQRLQYSCALQHVRRFDRSLAEARRAFGEARPGKERHHAAKRLAEIAALLGLRDEADRAARIALEGGLQPVPQRCGGL